MAWAGFRHGQNASQLGQDASLHRQDISCHGQGLSRCGWVHKSSSPVSRSLCQGGQRLLEIGSAM